MSDDILKGLLPTGDPLAPFAMEPSAPAAVGDDAGAGTEFSITPLQTAPTVGRRSPSAAGPLLAVFALLLFAAIGACLYLLVSGMGISQHGRLVAIEAEGDAEKENPDQERSAPPIVEDQPGRLPRSDAAPETDTATPAAAASPEAEPPPTSADQEEPPWNDVYQVLRSGKFAEMTSVTGAAVRAANTPEQRAKANRFHLLAELAEHYDQGIRRSAAEREAAEVLTLSSGVTVAVVESSREEIALKVEGRVKMYSLESPPLVLAHHLAAFALPEGDPLTEAGRGAYQALWPQATDAHRRQAFQWWEQLDGGADVDASELEAAVRELFEMPPDG